MRAPFGLAPRTGFPTGPGPCRYTQLWPLASSPRRGRNISAQAGTDRRLVGGAPPWVGGKTRNLRALIRAKQRRATELRPFRAGVFSSGHPGRRCAAIAAPPTNLRLVPAWAGLFRPLRGENLCVTTRHGAGGEGTRGQVAPGVKRRYSPFRLLQTHSCTPREIITEDVILLHSYARGGDAADDDKIRQIAEFCHRMGRETNQGEVALIIDGIFHRMRRF